MSDVHQDAAAGDGRGCPAPGSGSAEPDPPRREPGIVILFSGGLDTTLEVVERLKTHDQVHLLTFDNGWCVNVGSAARRAAELIAHARTDRIHHALVNTRPLLLALLEEARRGDGVPRSPLVADLACKMAAIVELIAYARKNGIRDVSDGAGKDQQQIFIQRPDFSAHIEPFLSACGLRLHHPVLFHLTREQKLERLAALDLSSGSRFLEALHITSQIAHQPFCMRGFITYFFTSPLRHLGVVKRRALSLEGAMAGWDVLLPVARDYLERVHGIRPAPPAA